MKLESTIRFNLQVFHTFLYSFSVGILAYFLFYLLHQRINTAANLQVGTGNVSLPHSSEIVSNESKRSGGNPNGSDFDLPGGRNNTIEDSNAFPRVKQKESPRGSIHDDALCSAEATACSGSSSEDDDSSGSDPRPTSRLGVSFDSEGLNFYLRLGAVGR
jgi:hypothetical protein